MRIAHVWMHAAVYVHSPHCVLWTVSWFRFLDRQIQNPFSLTFSLRSLWSACQLFHRIIINAEIVLDLFGAVSKWWLQCVTHVHKYVVALICVFHGPFSAKNKFLIIMADLLRVLWLKFSVSMTHTHHMTVTLHGRCSREEKWLHFLDVSSCCAYVCKCSFLFRCPSNYFLFNSQGPCTCMHIVVLLLSWSCDIYLALFCWFDFTNYWINSLWLAKTLAHVADFWQSF